MQTVLLVEDDHALAECVRDWLEILGYGVQLASSASEAIHQLEQNTIDFVLAEPILRDGSGSDLVDHLVETSSNFGVLTKWLPDLADRTRSSAAFLAQKPCDWIGENSVSTMIDQALSSSHANVISFTTTLEAAEQDYVKAA